MKGAIYREPARVEVSTDGNIVDSIPDRYVFHFLGVRADSQQQAVIRSM